MPPMGLSQKQREAVEAFWHAYYVRLDELAPHPPNTRGSVFSGGRKAICYACKDGILISFQEGPQFALQHKSSVGSIESLFSKMTAPLGFEFGGNGFPREMDVGPLTFAEGTVGETVDAPLFIYRLFWRDSVTPLTIQKAFEQAARDHERTAISRIYEGSVDTTQKSRPGH